MRILMLVVSVLCGGCVLTEALGAYTCEEYCSGIEDKVDTCAAEEGLSFEDFAGDDRASVLTRCQDEIDGRGLSDLQCQAETATINNASCADIAATVASF